MEGCGAKDIGQKVRESEVDGCKGDKELKRAELTMMEAGRVEGTSKGWDR